MMYFLFAILMVTMCLLLWRLYDSLAMTSVCSSTNSGKRTVIIDAGHGGKDGGAISLTGKAEKEINLSASLSLEAILSAQGYNVIMTRNEDCELVVDGSTASRKMQDLKGRLIIADGNPEAVFISIHMNKFPKEKYSGTQIYYADTNGSRGLADSAMSAVKAALQNSNTREIKKTTSAIYLLSHIKNPAVLIEYGFLSNRSEAELLEDPFYIRRLNIALYSGLSRGGM